MSTPSWWLRVSAETCYNSFFADTYQCTHLEIQLTARKVYNFFIWTIHAAIFLYVVGRQLHDYIRIVTRVWRKQPKNIFSQNVSMLYKGLQDVTFSQVTAAVIGQHSSSTRSYWHMTVPFHQVYKVPGLLWDYSEPMRNFRFSQRCHWRFKSPRMWCWVFGLEVSDPAKDHLHGLLKR